MPLCALVPDIAVIALALALLLGLWWLHGRALRRQVQRLRLRMNARLNARTHRARASIDTLRQSVQGLILKVHGVAMRMPPHEPLRAMLDDALTQAEGVVWDEPEWGRDLGVGGHEQEFAAMLSAFGEELGTWSGPAYHVLVQGTPRPLNAGVASNLFAIGREAMLNAFKHAHASQVLVLVAYRRRNLQLTVADNGLGLTVEELAKVRRVGHRGLDGMRERAKGLGAILQLRTHASGGAEWLLTLPAATAYFASKHCRWRWWQRWWQR